MEINRLFLLSAVPCLIVSFSFGNSGKALANQSTLIAQNFPPGGQQGGPRGFSGQQGGPRGFNGQQGGPQGFDGQQGGPRGFNGQQGGQRQRGELPPGFDRLTDLSDTQKAELKKIHESTREQMDTIFTSAQREQLHAAREQGQRPNLNLSDEQRSKMRTIHESTKSKIDGILTEQQRQQLEQMRPQSGQRGQ